LAGVVIAAAVSFLIAAFILKTSKSDEQDLSEATDKMEEMKGKKSSVSGKLKDGENGKADVQAAEDYAQPAVGGEADGQSEEKPTEDVNKIIFACDAGMGSSAMGASLLKNKFKKAEIDIDVSNTAIKEIPNDADIVITHKDLTEQAKEKLPSAEHISVENFLNSPKYDELTERLKK